MARSDKIAEVLFFFFLLKICSQLAMSHSLVKFLPGFEGPLPFELETGYVGVGESDDVQLFYYFIKSERNPGEDPLLLWLTGGPGCSSLSGLVYEIGPLNFNVVEYNGSLPTLVLNPYSWTKISSIIFVDSPVGTGFSYATNQHSAQSSDFKQVHHLHQFLQKWLMDHPEFLSNPVYIAGDSYAGIILPVLFQEILYGNEEGIRPLINLQGYILGNPRTAPTVEDNSRISFAHRMALISDELYDSLKRSCRGEYQNIDPRNVECQKDLQYYTMCISGINPAHILKPLCSFDSFTSPHPQEMVARMCPDGHQKELLDSEPSTLPKFGCLSYSHLLSSYWANDRKAKKAIHIRKGSIGQWNRCNFGLPYTADVPSSFPFHVNLSSRGYRALVYSGDHDMVIPFLGTEAWIKSLNYPIVDDWRPWMVKDQVAGYTRTYSNQMTYATIKAGGHTAPEYKPAEGFAMFRRWISGEPL
ncbi:serine carboxypeptidase-like 7 [Herrania umbratica]|uniref:Serine carboxypeptidase-like 7 n=1 Tax=Herrania umbratica TaxID=108875 RepID=A0A6J1ACL3_9ROSI|nr:serine carboxypeptidase-like 7 [Herrania umbratica]